MSAERLSPLVVQRLRGLPDIGINETVSIGFEMMGFNTRRPPWSDVTMRKAAAHAINLADISDVATAGFKPPAGAGRVISPSNGYWYNPDVPQYDYNVEKARQLLKDAGYEWDSQGRLYYPAK